MWVWSVLRLNKLRLTLFMHPSIIPCLNMNLKSDSFELGFQNTIHLGEIDDGVPYRHARYSDMGHNPKEPSMFSVKTTALSIPMSHRLGSCTSDTYVLRGQPQHPHSLQSGHIDFPVTLLPQHSIASMRPSCPLTHAISMASTPLSVPITGGPLFYAPLTPFTTHP